MKMRYLSHDYASKSYSTIIEQNFSNCINRINTINTRVRVTHYAIFGKPYLPPLSKYYLLLFTQLPISYQLLYHIISHNILHKIQLYSIQLYRYYNTVIAM